MTNKELRSKAALGISVNSKRFLENLVESFEVFNFCINISKNKRVTGQIIRHLTSMSIEE